MILKCDLGPGRVCTERTASFIDANGQTQSFYVDVTHVHPGVGVDSELVMYLGARALVILPNGKSVAVPADTLTE